MPAPMRVVTNWLPILAAGVLGACASQAGQSQADLGKAYFAGFGCVKCHTVAGSGGQYGPDLTYIGFRKTPQWLDAWLKDPHGWKQDTVMPNLHLNDSVRGALVAYLGTLKGESYRGSPPWAKAELAQDSVKRGEAIFNSVGCVGCHGKAGVGGYPNNNVAGGKIPALTLVADGYSKDELKTKIKNGVPKPDKEDPRGPDPMIHMPSWGQVLQDSEIDALADYLISLKPKGPASKDDF